MSGWRVEVVRGTQLVRCEALERVPRVAHAFSCRGADGASTLLEAAGLAGGRPMLLRQVHGVELVEAEALRGSAGAPPLADGALAFEATAGGRVPAVRTADCVPLLLAAVDGRAVAAVHAGWRGTAGGIVERALSRLRARGFTPDRLLAALGPAIGVCCYEVGGEVAAAVAEAGGVGVERLTRRDRGRLRLDLPLAVRLQLSSAGLPDEAIHVAPWCTGCADELFFSHRREGAGTGRQIACIGWPAPGPP